MTSLMRTTRTRVALGALATTALLTLSACGGGDSDSASADKDASASPSTSESADADAPAGAEPDLEGIPDVVAEVNGEEVTKDEFVPIYESQYAQAAQQAQTTGQAPDEEALKKQTVDNLVDTELLAQEAESRGIEVSDEDVDAELADIAEQNQMGSADELLAAVVEQGVTEEQALEQVETQLMVEQLVEDEDGPLEPTDKELRALYAQVKQQAAQSGGGAAQQIPPFAQARAQLVEQATSQKVGEVAQTLVEGLREDADITINL
ncbi:peptidyl-prolyl cis-trans isomerase SurA [Nocardioides alpinus]|uniref:peptidylprolyl isomerase n=1 Tax=Nocardioides alpinus TaxID=748909 RepID=A0A1I0ZJL3_9ACTN|nr:SurA N-terminal domain-containing protein [Nocardioides alpinus]PKH40613.1 peptidylprolyl isomerase [Nocardioides alpinus]SFB24403.1 peptidyl-prolyl cis-trans isomerase SurA [Nocardioides alpinus]